MESIEEFFYRCVDDARMKILKGQARFIDRLLEALDQIEES
jgi:predicted NUDIX family NTP pyrophosphohydrolase